MEAIEKRYSVRNYADREIKPDKIEKILEAGRLAPTASNQQLNCRACLYLYRMSFIGRILEYMQYLGRL